jgi:hypothetical protein
LNHAEKILVLAVGLQDVPVALRVDGRLVGKVGLRKATMVLPLRQEIGMNPHFANREKSEVEEAAV